MSRARGVIRPVLNHEPARGQLSQLVRAATPADVAAILFDEVPRLRDNGAFGQGHIKTGTLDGVKTIAGYVRDKQGKWQIVVFLINHPNAAAGQGAQDALLNWLVDANPRR